MSEVVRRLRVITDAEPNPYLSVAFATSDGIWVDQHFGHAQGFTIYAVNCDGFHMTSAVQFEAPEGGEDEDKLSAKLEALNGCIAVYCKACGASAVKQLLALNIQPLKVSQETAIQELLKAFRQELIEGPSSWLARAIERGRVADFAISNDPEAGDG